MTKWNTNYQPTLSADTLVEVKGRYGDIYGPIPFEMISEKAWEGEMFHASHDIVAWRISQ